MSDFFKFENDDIDFPFYNGKPLLSTLDWIVLLAGVLLFLAIIVLPFNLDGNVSSLLFCLVVLIPIIYVSKGKLGLFFRMVERKDIKLIILCLLGYYIYSFAMLYLLEQLALVPPPNPVLDANMDLVFWIMAFIQLLGEELFKISIFLIVMHIAYKATSNRKLSMVCAVIIALVVFGLAHFDTYGGNLAHVILIIGFGGIFYFYAYLKTKNVAVGYIVHVLIDGIPFFMTVILNAM